MAKPTKRAMPAKPAKLAKYLGHRGGEGDVWTVRHCHRGARTGCVPQCIPTGDIIYGYPRTNHLPDPLGRSQQHVRCMTVKKSFGVGWAGSGRESWSTIARSGRGGDSSEVGILRATVSGFRLPQGSNRLVSQSHSLSLRPA